MNVVKNRGVILAALFAVTLAVAGCAGLRSESGHPSPEMSAILKERRITQWEVSTAGLGQMTAADSMKRADDLEHAEGMEVFTVPPKPGTKDALSYIIYVDHKAGEFWISQSGGMAGATLVFGPGKVESP